MKLITRWLVMIVILLVLPLSACGAQSGGEEEIKPVHLEPIEGTSLNRVILTEAAAERLDIQTAPVRDQQVSGVKRLVVPYAALLYDPSGDTWVYVNVEPLVFVRQSIVVDYIKGDVAVLSKGPEAGTRVVTTGATELFGSESEFEEE